MLAIRFNLDGSLIDLKQSRASSFLQSEPVTQSQLTYPQIQALFGR
ncbi:hypothetical protein ACI2KS_14565 [Pseudomonas sp. NPDC087358]